MGTARTLLVAAFTYRDVGSQNVNRAPTGSTVRGSRRANQRERELIDPLVGLVGSPYPTSLLAVVDDVPLLTSGHRLILSQRRAIVGHRESARIVHRAVGLVLVFEAAWTGLAQGHR